MPYQPNIKAFLAVLRGAEFDKCEPKKWEVSAQLVHQILNDDEFLKHAELENGELITILGLPVIIPHDPKWDFDRLYHPFQLIASMPGANRLIAITDYIDREPAIPLVSFGV